MCVHAYVRMCVQERVVCIHGDLVCTNANKHSQLWWPYRAMRKSLMWDAGLRTLLLYQVLCMCMYVCVCIYIYVCVCMYVCVYAFMCDVWKLQSSLSSNALDCLVGLVWDASDAKRLYTWGSNTLGQLGIGTGRKHRTRNNNNNEMKYNRNNNYNRSSGFDSKVEQKRKHKQRQRQKARVLRLISDPTCLDCGGYQSIVRVSCGSFYTVALSGNRVCVCVCVCVCMWFVFILHWTLCVTFGYDIIDTHNTENGRVFVFGSGMDSKLGIGKVLGSFLWLHCIYIWCCCL